MKSSYSITTSTQPLLAETYRVVEGTNICFTVLRLDGWFGGRRAAHSGRVQRAL